PDYKFRQLKQTAMKLSQNFNPIISWPSALADGIKSFQFKALFLLFTLAFFASDHVQAADLKVCKTCDHKTVTSAVKAANPNDRILVQSGYYVESNIEIRKPLQLIGVGKPVIDAKNKGGIFQIETHDVLI